jgi:hypothetical protein
VTRTLSPDEARAKLAVRTAILTIGGVDGAAATVARSRSTVGRWICLNEADMPPLDAVMAIDAVLVAMGQAPLVLTAALAAVGHVPFALPGGCAQTGALHVLLANQAKEAGDVTAFLAETLSKGAVPSAHDAALLMIEVDQMLAVGVAMRAALTSLADAC